MGCVPSTRTSHAGTSMDLRERKGASPTFGLAAPPGLFVPTEQQVRFKTVIFFINKVQQTYDYLLLMWVL